MPASGARVPFRTVGSIDDEQESAGERRSGWSVGPTAADGNMLADVGGSGRTLATRPAGLALRGSGRSHAEPRWTIRANRRGHSVVREGESRSPHFLPSHADPAVSLDERTVFGLQSLQRRFRALASGIEASVGRSVRAGGGASWREPHSLGRCGAAVSAGRPRWCNR